MSFNPADVLITDLGASLGMGDLHFSPAGSCQLVFDQRWVVTLIVDSVRRQITLNCPVSQADQADQLSRPTLLAMLQANFMGQGCVRATLSMGSDQRAYLQTAVSLGEAARSPLHGALELLLNQAETWSARLTQGHAALAPSPVSARSRSAGEAAPWARQRV
jgi:hypothetical protein